MKKFLSKLLCAALVAMALSVTAFAAEAGLLISPAPALPQRQGDFGVMVNGEYVSFPDALPQAKDNRSFLPMAAVFSQLGFAQEDMTWTPDGSVTATKDDLIVALTMGKPEITIVRGDETIVVPTDVAPYVDPATWRTYIPFGLVADALGYKVGWDGNTKTVLIDDVEAILAANTENYTLMDEYTAYSRRFAGDRSALQGNYSFGLVMGRWTDGSIQDTTLLLHGKYDMALAAPSVFDFRSELDVTCTETVNGEDVTQSAINAGALAPAPETLELSMRGDLALGTVYLHSDGLCQLIQRPDLAGSWLRFPSADLTASAMTDSMQAMGSALAPQHEHTSFLPILKQMLAAAPITDPEQTTRDYLAMYNAMFADSAFTEQTNGYVNEATISGVPVTITLSTKSGSVNGCTYELRSQGPSGAMSLMAGSRGNEMILSMNLDTGSMADLSAPEGSYLVMSLGMDGSYHTASAAPAPLPPDGAAVAEFPLSTNVPEAAPIPD